MTMTGHARTLLDLARRDDLLPRIDANRGDPRSTDPPPAIAAASTAIRSSGSNQGPFAEALEKGHARPLSALVVSFLLGSAVAAWSAEPAGVDCARFHPPSAARTAESVFSASPTQKVLDEIVRAPALSFAADDLLPIVFHPAPAVEEVVASVRERIRRPVVCLHARTGFAEQGVPFLSPGDERRFVERSRTLVAEARSTFLATDDAGLSARLRKEIGAVTADVGPILHTRPLEVPSRAVDPDGVIRAFADWVLLSECDAIVGTAWSTFGRSAALRGRGARFVAIDDSRCGQVGPSSDSHPARRHDV